VPNQFLSAFNYPFLFTLAGPNDNTIGTTGAQFSSFMLQPGVYQVQYVGPSEIPAPVLNGQFLFPLAVPEQLTYTLPAYHLMQVTTPNSILQFVATSLNTAVTTCELMNAIEVGKPPKSWSLGPGG
jgi:hypothetical protein